MGVRIIVTGDRNWYCPDLAERIVNRLVARYGPDVVCVHGGATGVDRSFAEACETVGVQQEAHPARWEERDAPGAVIRYDRRGRPYNANAGPQRNGEMVKAGARLCIAVHRDINASKGTKDCARQCIAAGIPVWLIDGEDAEPVRVRGI
jgi:hypothetical protein